MIRTAIKWLRNRGRDGWSSVLDVALDRSVESMNIHLYDGGLGTRRGGSTSLTITGVTAPINHGMEFIPGQDPTAAELFLVDNSATVKILRCAGGSSFTSLTLQDAPNNAPYRFSSATLNGKLWMAYDSAVNRIHVYDPNNNTASYVRRGGLGPFGSAATVANTGAGAYPATLRYYKTRITQQQSSVTVLRSEGNASVSFTPSGAGTAARITRPGGTGDDVTHWEVYGSTDDVTFYGPIATIAIATTTYDDSSTPSTWASTYDAEPVAGTYTPFPSVKSIGTDGSRLYGLGVYETSAGDSLAPKAGRFYFGPVLDSTSTHDDERINNTTTLKGFIDLARNANGIDAGVSPRPVNNIIYAFQSAGVYGLIPTESATRPYRRVVLSSDIGNIDMKAIVMASDRTGRPCCFFCDPARGPYVVGGSDGLAWCGKDVVDVWATVNRDAALPVVGVWYPDRSQVVFFLATGANTVPNEGIVLDVTEMAPDEDGDLRGGWTRYSGDFCATRFAALFSNTLNATRSSTKTVYTGGNSKLLRYDESVYRDDTTAFQSYVTSGGLAVESDNLSVEKAYLAASAQSGVTIQQSFIRNTGDETDRTSTVSLTAVGSETTVLRKFEDAALQDAWAIQVKLGDSATANVAWQLYQWRGKVASGAER